MNKQIKELAEQAGGISGNTAGREEPIVFFYESDLEKFAELIVRECADYLDAFNRENMVEEGIGGAELKEHFGVEE